MPIARGECGIEPSGEPRLRKTALATAVSLLVLVGFVVPVAGVAAAGTGDPKVVIIVGPVGGQTSSYRATAESAAAVASQYTSNVVKVYSPTATWSAAKAALQGASVVIYLGHGNGFPSPYRSSPWPYSQNGMGLNPTAGTDNTTVKYYGEYYLGNEVQLAPNAVVLINGACYSAGNSEPGYPEPSLSVAQQRVDNFAAGWLAAGARAVIASPYWGPEYYLNALFTTNQTVDQLWRSAPDFHSNLITFPSSRTPGMTAQMDPETPTSGYKRAIVGDLGLTTDTITGARYGNTAGDPSTFVVPGNAEVTVQGAGLYPDPSLSNDPATSLPSSTLDAGTRLRLIARVGSDPFGQAVFQAATADGSRSGFVSAGSLAPRDSTAPRAWGIEDGDGAVSPNGDGRNDQLMLNARLSEPATWQIRFLDASGSTLASQSGAGDTLVATWDGRANGGYPVPDGSYTYEIQAADSWGNGPGITRGQVIVDTVAPQLGSLTAFSGPVTFSPNGDGVGDKLSLRYTTSEAGSIDATVANEYGAVVSAFSATASSAGAGTATWAGDANGGGTVPDGRYNVTLTPRDLAGNVGAPQVVPVAVYTSLARVRSAAVAIYPHDGDALGTSTQLSFELRAPATVTWTITDSAGRVVRTLQASSPLVPGTYTTDWTGTDDAGALLPLGAYYATVDATNGNLSIRSRALVVLGAFRLVVSDTTPARGQSITVTATTAEPLYANARLTVRQPGYAAWAVTMTKISATAYRATIRLRSSGPLGSVQFSVSGRDVAGGTNAAALVLPLH